MKQLVALALALLIAPSALGQSVGASQIRKKTDGGLVADSANALTIGIKVSVTAPASPVTGQAWCDSSTTPCSLKVWSGSAWTIPPTGAAITQADLTSFPATPTDGMLLWIRSLKRMVVYEAASAAWYYLDAAGRSAQADYSLETAGYTTTFLSSPGATTGGVAAGGTMTVGTHVCAITHYNSVGGETIPGGTTAAMTIDATNKTANLTFAATGAGVRGKRVWCSKANATTPLWLITTIDDTTTGNYAVTVADTAFGVQTAPDVDFSAPAPTGWTAWIPDATYGGCGSTGTSLLCVAYKSGGATSGSGPRLLYNVAGSPAAWRIRWKVTRADSGFPGNTALADYVIAPFAAMSSPSVAIPATRGVGFSWSAAGTSVVPFSASKTAIPVATSRNTGGAYTLSTPTTTAWPPIDSTPLWVEAEHIDAAPQFAYRFNLSHDGRSWVPAYVPSGTTAMTLCDASTCSTTRLPYVGIALEEANGTNMTGLLVEIKEFTYKTE